MIDKNIKPVPGMIFRNGENELRTVSEVHEEDIGNCPMSLAGRGGYTIPGPHLWTNIGTYVRFPDLYDKCTLVSMPESESIIKIIDKTKSRLDLITD